MSSENKTPNLQLNQWKGNEYPKRTDFIEDNKKIDEAYKGLKDSIKDGGKVSSVNGKIGDVILKAEDIKTESGDTVQSQMAESTTILTPTGTANSIILNITMLDKKKYSFKAIANSTGNVTINGKLFKKLDGTQIGSGDIKVNKVYDFYYDLASESVFILAKAIGNAAVGDVLAGKTFSNSDNNELIGTMPNRGNLDVIVTQIAGNAIPIGYHNGLGKAKINIEAGDTIAYSDTTSVGRKSDEWNTVREVRIDTAGRYRISFNLRLSDYTATGHGRIYKNGYAYGIMREIRTNIDTMFTEDFTFKSGDLVQLRLLSNGRTTLTNKEFNISFDAVLPTITKIY